MFIFSRLLLVIDGGRKDFKKYILGWGEGLLSIASCAFGYRPYRQLPRAALEMASCNFGLFRDWLKVGLAHCTVYVRTTTGQKYKSMALIKTFSWVRVIFLTQGNRKFLHLRWTKWMKMTNYQKKKKKNWCQCCNTSGLVQKKTLIFFNIVFFSRTFQCIEIFLCL